jgi:uncharacterized protein (TIGR02145 family)
MHPEIDKLIEMALADGQVTEKEREIILRKAEKLGLDLDEVEMYLEGKLAVKSNQTDSTNILKNDFDEVTIGNQIWMSKNLNVDKFRNGDPIPYAKYESDWIEAFENKKPVYGYLDNNPNNEYKYGKIYNWYAIIDKRGLAPEGWKIPTVQDWETLINFLGGQEFAGEKMKSNSENWNNFGFGNNSSGFSAEPGGNISIFLQDFSFRDRIKGKIYINHESEGNVATFFSSSTHKKQVTDIFTGEKINGKFKNVYTRYEIWYNHRNIYSLYSNCDGDNVYVRCLKKIK